METCKECNIEFDSLEFVYRHQRSHKRSAQEYVLKWQHDGKVPLCACGCGKNTRWNVGIRNFTTFIKGHSSKGRIKSEDEKRRIGEKNRINMKQWMSRHPDIAAKRGSEMSLARTPEIEARRIEATKSAYASMSSEDKKKFSDHAKELWQDGTLAAAHAKASQTFKDRFANGEYDFTERNDKISATITQRYLDGGFEWSTGQYTSSKTGDTCNYRSSWERELMERLDLDPRVDIWKYEPLFITYTHEGKSKRYIPDFMVVLDGQTLLVEVKPPSLTDTDMNEAKRQAALDFCQRNGWKYRVWNPEAVF